jgi:site-specific DNA-methyltransferase (adenine-specific)
VSGSREDVVFRGDALDLDRAVAPASIALAYLDPPFAVQKEFRARTRPGEERRAGGAAYDDRWSSLDAYLDFLEARLTVVHGLLAAEGAMVLHLDHRAIHDAKVRADRVFGRARFRGEIIWVPGNGAKGRRDLGVTHQTLLVYGKGTTPVWNAKDEMLREPFAATSLSMHFTHIDETGRRYRERTVGKKTYRYYADEGRALGSVWTDCPAMLANSPLPGLKSETTGYPTQKPLKLLERLVRALTHEGDVVLDPFMGSGTTLVAAARHRRRFVGCDPSPLALRITQDRLAGERIPFVQRELERRGSAA